MHGPDFGAPGQTVLVTGGTGFVGQHLVRALLGAGQDVLVLSRDPVRASRLFGDRVRCVASLDALDAQEKLDVIVHLAGARIFGWRWTAARKAVLLASRAGISKAICAWIARAARKPRLFLAASAIGYYGVQDPQDPRALNEGTPPQAIFMSQLCQEAEAAARAAVGHGVQVGAMRFGFVIGAGGALPGMLMPIRLGLGGPLAGGRQVLSWIHIDDLVAGIGHLMRAAHVDGAYNFTAPLAVTQLEFSRTAARLLHRPCFMPTPAWPMRLVLGEQATLLLDGQRVAPQRLQADGFAFAHPDLESALRAAGC